MGEQRKISEEKGIIHTYIIMIMSHVFFLNLLGQKLSTR
jgi:hypothetical protein